MMQYIEHILYFARDFWILSIVLGFLAAYIESFIPALPLMAIAAVNAAINGFVVGFIVSWLGSCAGTISVFIIAKKLMGTKFFEKHRSDKLTEMVEKVKKMEFKAIFIFYTIPVIPSSLITLASSYCKIDYKEFIPPMMSGKFLMMFLVSYIGSDVIGFFKSPIKIAVVLITSVVAYFLATKVKKDLELREDDAIIEYSRFKNKRIIQRETNRHIAEIDNKKQLSKNYYFANIVVQIKYLINKMVNKFRQK